MVSDSVSASLLFISILQQDQTLDLLSGNREVIELLIVVLHIIPSFACLPHMINLLSATVNRGRDNCAFIRAAVHFIYNRYLSIQLDQTNQYCHDHNWSCSCRKCSSSFGLFANGKLQNTTLGFHVTSNMSCPSSYIFMGEPQYTNMSQGN